MGSDALTKETEHKAVQKHRLQIGGLVAFIVAVLLLVGYTYYDQDAGQPSSEMGILLKVRKGLKDAEQELGDSIKSRMELERKVKSLERALEKKQSATGDGGVACQSEGWTRKSRGERFAFVTAFNGGKYDVMGMLASDTKAKYAAYRGYAYFTDNDLLVDNMSFQQKSGSRIGAFRRHWDGYEWLIWTDADVLLTNPEISLESIVEEHAPEGSGIHVIMSKDWGGRQVNPGVTFLRTTPEGKQFLDRWAAEIETAQRQDDLLAIKQGMEPKKAEELKYLKFVPQHVLNSYPSDSLRFEAYNSTTVEHHSSHEFWQPGHMFVHVVNCLRQAPGRIDAACCNGIAARYWHEFTIRLQRLLDDASQDKDTPLTEDWTRAFKAHLCLS